MAPDSPQTDVPALLNAMAQGDAAAAERLFPLVYDELHRIASCYMRRERPDHTLQATALVHEAFMRLAGSSSEAASSDAAAFDSRRHFVATAAVAMRRILVNHAKARAADKRGGGRATFALDDVAAEFSRRSIDLLALEEALERLAALDPRQARLVELRFFGGMTFEDCAATLDISVRTVHYEWAHARAWLRDQIGGT